MLNEHDPFNAYQQTSLEAKLASATPHDMVRMLLEGLLEELDRVAGHMEQQEFEAKGVSINKCLNIIHGLDSMLDMDNGGEIASNLHQLYDYCSRQLVNASVNNQPEELNPVRKVMIDVREGWSNFN